MAMIGIKGEAAPGDVARTWPAWRMSLSGLIYWKIRLIIEVVQESNEKLLDFLVDTLEDIPGILHRQLSASKAIKESYDWG